MQPSTSSNVGKWNDGYKALDAQDMGAFRYGDTVTYRMAAAFLADVAEVEDWGCDAGGFKRYCRSRYIGIDGRQTPFADKVVDLCTYSSSPQGIMMRHVLEHNYEWEKILDGALRSFTKKFCLILFTPFSATPREIAHNKQHGVDVPDLSLARADIERKLTGLRWELIENIPTDTGYKIEHVYLIWRPETPRADTGFLRHSLDEIDRNFSILRDSYRGQAARLLRKAKDLLTRPSHPAVLEEDILQGVLTRYRTWRNAYGAESAPRRAVYTAIFGQYDTLHPLPVVAGVDAICFTDDPDLQAPGWQIRVVKPEHAHPRLAAKCYKALPHRYLPEYAETLWIDGSFHVHNPSYAKDLFAYLEAEPMALFLHPERGCIYDEAAFCKDLAKYVGQDVLGQVAHYRAEGFPDNFGLFACGVIARRNTDPRVQRLGEQWMAENLRFTYQDQLSLPYLLWKLDLKPAVFRQFLWKNSWGVWERHAHDR